jgi:hypothetical protein
MIHNRKLFIGISMLFIVSCIIEIPALGGTVSSGSFADPTTGLDSLKHYRAILSVVIQAQASDGPDNQTSTYALAAWPAEKAYFESIESTNAASRQNKMILGKVGDAGYLLPDGETDCQTNWAESNIHIDSTSLAPLMYLFESGASSGEETINGIATHVYSLNTDSVGIDGVQADGKAWIASVGGYLVKYHLELSGGQELFGSDETGKKILDYALTEINDGSPIVYPGDCRPVLTDIPAADDAKDIKRFPEILRYSSALPPDQVQAFYEKYFTGQGWKARAEHSLPDGEKIIGFYQEATNREATIMIESHGATTSVEVMAPVVDSNPAPSSTGEPASSGADQNVQARISAALSKLLGNGKTPGPIPSYRLKMDESMPASSGERNTSLQAEVQGVNIHFVLNGASGTKDVFLYDGKEYDLKNGIAQPGSPTLRSDWILWRMDPSIILSMAGLAAPKPQASVTLEGHSVDVFAVDSSQSKSPLPDVSMGLSFQITSIRGTVWIDHETNVLLKADLEFEAGVKKPGDTKSSSTGKGALHLSVDQLGSTTVMLPS